jgi:TPR repeat protein
MAAPERPVGQWPAARAADPAPAQIPAQPSAPSPAPSPAFGGQAPAPEMPAQAAPPVRRAPVETIAALPPSVVAPKPPASPPASVPSAGREEIAMLLARGRKYLADGDVSAARLVLRRAAESGDGQAALALGGTYDPNVLRELGVVSFASDPAQARAWYQRAAALGAPDAPRRIEQLAQSGR